MAGKDPSPLPDVGPACPLGRADPVIGAEASDQARTCRLLGDDPFHQVGRPIEGGKRASSLRLGLPRKRPMQQFGVAPPQQRVLLLRRQRLEDRPAVETSPLMRFEAPCLRKWACLLRRCQ